MYGESFIFIIIPFIFQLQNYYIHVLIAALKNVLCVIFLNKKTSTTHFYNKVYLLYNNTHATFLLENYL